MARMWHVENVIKAAQELFVLDADMVLEHAENLFGHLVFRDAIVIVKSRLRAPADMECRVDMRLRPLHDFGDLVPVGDFLKRHVLDGRTRDDHAVVLLVAHFLERAVELRKVVCGRMARDVRLRVDEIDLDLDGAVAEEPHELRLRDVLDGHEVQNQNLQRADVLCIGTVFIHDEDVLTFEDVRRRQGTRQFDWHINSSYREERPCYKLTALYHIFRTQKSRPQAACRKLGTHRFGAVPVDSRSTRVLSSVMRLLWPVSIFSIKSWAALLPRRNMF